MDRLQPGGYVRSCNQDNIYLSHAVQCFPNGHPSNFNFVAITNTFRIVCWQGSEQNGQWAVTFSDLVNIYSVLRSRISGDSRSHNVCVYVCLSQKIIRLNSRNSSVTSSWFHPWIKKWEEWYFLEISKIERLKKPKCISVRNKRYFDINQWIHLWIHF